MASQEDFPPPPPVRVASNRNGGPPGGASEKKEKRGLFKNKGQFYNLLVLENHLFFRLNLSCLDLSQLLNKSIPASRQYIYTLQEMSFKSYPVFLFLGVEFISLLMQTS